jgi:hypothetical protein
MPKASNSDLALIKSSIEPILRFEHNFNALSKRVMTVVRQDSHGNRRTNDSLYKLIDKEAFIDFRRKVLFTGKSLGHLKNEIEKSDGLIKMKTHIDRLNDLSFLNIEPSIKELFSPEDSRIKTVEAFFQLERKIIEATQAAQQAIAQNDQKNP